MCRHRACQKAPAGGHASTTTALEPTNQTHLSPALVAARAEGFYLYTMDVVYLILLSLFFLFFFFVAWYRFYLGIGLVLFFLPAYLIRFHLGPLPTTVLEVMIWTIVLIFFIQTTVKAEWAAVRDRLIHIARQRKTFFIAAGVFLLSATVSIFTALDTRAALGEWKAFYVEPFLFFLIIIGAGQNTEQRKHLMHSILVGLVFSGLATALLAIYQHNTGWMVPWAFWENGQSYRVTGWYGFPNGVGLFLAPLPFLALLLLSDRGWKNFWLARLPAILLIVTVPLALIYAKSTGGLIGLLAGIGLLLLFHAKTRWPALVIGAIGILGVMTTPALEPIKNEMLARDRSGQIRVAMWGEAVELLSDRPVVGAGLASYQDRVRPYHTTVNGDGIEIFHHPHNLFLTMYVNLGIMGLMGFIWLLVSFYRSGLHQPFFLAAMTTIVVHGLVDSPYIKNDLAVLFWILPALLLLSEPIKKPD